MCDERDVRDKAIRRCWFQVFLFLFPPSGCCPTYLGQLGVLPTNGTCKLPRDMDSGGGEGPLAMAPRRGDQGSGPTATPSSSGARASWRRQGQDVAAGRLGRLLPLGVNADQAAEGAGEADEAIVKGDPAQGRGGDGEVAEVAEELEVAGGSLPGRAQRRVSKAPKVERDGSRVVGRRTWRCACSRRRPRRPCGRWRPRDASAGAGCRAGRRR